MNKFKKKVTMFTTMLAFLTVSCAAVNAAGIADNAVMGKTSNMDITKTSTTRMDVNINSGKTGDVGQVDWSRFNVGKGERVNFGFSNVSQTVINRVLGGQESKILGQLTNSCTTGSCANNFETSKVILINPAGVMFGAGSQVDLNSFTVSTFDFNGAKNLKNMSESELAAYQAGTLDKLSPIKVVNGTGVNKGYINFDSNYVKAFKDAGIDMSKFQGKTNVELNGTKFAHFNTDADGNLLDSFADSNPNKSVNIVSDNITYKDSLIRTGGNNNYAVPSANYTSSNSNVRLVTADGVTFGYVSNGYSDGYEETAADTKTNVQRNIIMDNSGLAKGTAAIESGDVKIKNISNANGSNIKVKETYVKANKLFNLTQNGKTDASAGGEHGNITILGTHNVDVEGSRLESVNTQLNGKTTNSQAGGEVKIVANGEVNVKDSLLKSAAVDKANFKDTYYVQMNDGINTSGQVNVVSNTSNVNVNNSEVISAEDFNIDAGKKVAFDGSLGFSEKGDISFNAKNQIDINNGALKANNIGLDATASGAINITSTKNGKHDTSFTTADNSQAKSKSVLEAKGDINIKANNTKIDGASLKYDNMKLYDSTYTNNVTVAGGVTLTPKSGKDVTVETNGNLTFDNANVLYGENPTGVTVGAIANQNGPDEYTYKLDGTGNLADNLTARSTKGNVTVQNSSELQASKNVNIKSDTSQVSVNESKIEAGETANINSKIANRIQKSTINGQDVNIISEAKNGIIDSTINAKTGNATVRTNQGDTEISNSKIEAANDATVKAYKDVRVSDSNILAGSDSTGFDKVKDANDTIGNVNIEATTGAVNISGSNIESQDQDVNITSYKTIAFGTGKNITPDNQIKGANNVNITSTGGDITAEKTDMGDIEYGNRLKFDAKGDNIFTSQNSLKSVNVDYKAGGANRIYTEGDSQFVNSSLEAPNNFIESGHDVIMNNLEIKQATNNAKDTKTQIFANGNVTTDNVTNEDLTAKGGVFPQSVSVDRSGKGKTVLDINQTKLTVETQTVKDFNNPDNGSITLDVKDANNSQAGLELTAINVDQLSKDPTGGYHKQGYFKSGTSKWDNNIKPKEGPEVHLNATDNEVSIARIETDKLTLDPNDTKIADTTKGTPTIIVKDQGGFNLDPNLDYNPDKTGDGYTYDKNYETHLVDQTGGDLEMGDWTDWHPTGRQWTDPDGTKHVEYERTRDGEITDRTTITIDKAHKITFDNHGNEQEFTLLYDKQETKVDPGHTIKAEDVKVNPSIVPPGTTPDDFIQTKDEKCEPAPVIDPDSYINQIKLPREIKEVSKVSKVTDNTVDQSANVMSAAAKVQIADEDGNTEDIDEDLEDID